MEQFVGDTTDLSKPLYRSLYRLNYRSEGAMRYALVRTKNTPGEGSVAALWEYGVGVIAWGIVAWDEDIEGYEVNIYVRKSHRRQGYGTKIYNLLAQFDKREFKASPWDNGSTKFYEKNGAVHSGWDA